MMNLLGNSGVRATSYLGAVVTLFVALTDSSVQAAQVVFDNGLPDLKSANEASAWVQAEDFLLTTAKTITGVNFWSIETPNNWRGNSNYGWNGTIRYSIFSDVSGKPSNSALFSGNGVNISKTATNRTYTKSSLQLNEYAYSFNFNSPIEIAANTTYWLGLHLSDSFNSGQVDDRNNVYWVTSSTGYGNKGTESFNGGFNNWRDTGVERAFQLTSSENVPEPMTILGTMTAIGFGAALRRRQNKNKSPEC